MLKRALEVRSGVLFMVEKLRHGEVKRVLRLPQERWRDSELLVPPSGAVVTGCRWSCAGPGGPASPGADPLVLVCGVADVTGGVRPAETL